MPDLAAVLQNGVGNPIVYLPLAVLLGALHALEPGHAKSLMAAFIVAIRGTSKQAVLLGVAAATGHTIIVWALALLGLYFGSRMNFERVEPWLVLLSGLLIIVLAARLLRAVRRDAPRHGHGHDDDHSHDGHGDEHHHGHDHHNDGDAHAAAHARDIEARFKDRSAVSNAEIAWFGFTGGLLPCPAAIAVLLVCLQLKAFTLGVAMVAAFSLGLAITLVVIGLAAAWGTQTASQSWSGFEVWAPRLPSISAIIVMLLGVLMSLRGLWELGVFGSLHA